MSLAATALRLATVYALRGATVAADSVLDAPIDPIERAKALAGAVIAAYTSDQKFTPEPGKRALTHDGVRKVELRLQIFLPAEVEIKTGGATITIDVREEGGALLLDAIYRQIERALTVNSPWRDLWADLVLALDEIKIEDLVVPVERGVDLVAREVTFQCRLIPGPAVGREAKGIWPRLVALMQAEPDLAPIAGWIKAEITEGGALSGEDLIFALAGLSRARAAGLGLAWPEAIDPAPDLVRAANDGPMGEVVVTSDEVQP